MTRAQFALYLRTLARLKPGQVMAQAAVRLHGFRPAPPASEAPVFPGWRSEPIGEALAARGAFFNPAEALHAGRWCFLNEVQTTLPGRRWQIAEGSSKLWRYNLHYHEWLWSLEPLEGAAMVGDWLHHHPANMQTDAWEPYVLSLRLQNWLPYFATHARSGLDHPEWQRRWWSAVWQQAEALRRNLEHHLQGNHLLENYLALAMVGAAFAGDWAHDLWHFAWPRLQRELGRQFLADGTHEERSPMYQARLVYALAQLCLFLEDPARAIVRGILQNAATALERLSHPDGDVALLGDSALGIAHPTATLIHHLERQGLAILHPVAGGWALPQAGYFGWRDERRCLIADLGGFGPRHQPGHAHADFGSFELSLDGHRVITDTGVFHYLADAVRLADRETAAHNTVKVEGLPQIELWSAFRAARESRVSHLLEQADEQHLRVRGWLDSFPLDEASYRHGRCWQVAAGGRLSWQDSLHAHGVRNACSRLHLSPLVAPRLQNGLVKIPLPDLGSWTLQLPGSSTWEMGQSPYHPAFQGEIKRSCLIGQFSLRNTTQAWTYRLHRAPRRAYSWHDTCQVPSSVSTASHRPL